MDSIVAASKELKWSEEVMNVDKIEEKFGFPQIVKSCAKTSSDYKLPADEVVFLLSKRTPVRLIAQTIEEGEYVMGKQLEISSEYNGLFKVNNDFERELTPLMTFRSIQEVADAYPPKVYLQKQLTITPTESAAKGLIVLEKGDELTIITKLESQHSQGLTPKSASKLFNRVLRSQQNYLMVNCQRLNESLRLPYSVQGWFATRPPTIIFLTEKRGVISLQQIMEKANFPTTVTVTTNSSRSVKDEFLLRAGMHLKLIGLEEHDIVLGVTPSHQIVEFSSKDVAFKLPSILSTSSMESDDERTQLNQYQTYLLSSYMNSKVQNSPSNIDEYCSSVRFHIPRKLRATKPVPLNCNASLRTLVLNPSNQRKRMNVGDSTRGLSAAQRLHNPQLDERISDAFHNNRRENPSRHMNSTSNPPLPPRNTKLPKSAPYSKREVPSPPKSSSIQSSQANSAATPTVGSTWFSEPTMDSTRGNKTTQQIASADEEESIWETFVPKSKPPNQSNGAIETSKGIVPSAAPHYSQQNGVSISNHQDAVSGRQPPNLVPKDYIVQRDVSLALPALQEEDRMLNDDLSIPSHNQVAKDYKRSWMAEDIYSNAEDVEDPTSTGPALAQQVMLEVNSTADADRTTKLTDGHSTKDEEVADVSSNLDQKSSQTETGTKPHVNGDGLEATQQLQVSTKSYASPPKLWTPPDDVCSFTVDETKASLRYIGLSEDVVTMFGNERIDGSMLSELTDAMLEEDFHLSKLYRLKIKRFIQGWRPKLPLSKGTSLA